MQKLLLLSIAISCISSLSASAVGTTADNTNVFQAAETDSLYTNQAKDRYYNNVRYATYTAIASFIANLICLASPEHKDASKSYLGICAISLFVGLANMLKWLTIHIGSPKQASDIYFIDISEKLIFTFIALVIQADCERMLKNDPNCFSKK